MTPIPMKTSILGQNAPWPPKIQDLFAEKLPRLESWEVVTDANYFTPRPFVNEYDQGSRKEGFVYTLNHRRVCFVEWEAS